MGAKQLVSVAEPVVCMVFPSRTVPYVWLVLAVRECGNTYFVGAGAEYMCVRGFSFCGSAI